MLNLAILTRDPALCSVLEQIALESGVFQVSASISPLPSPPEILRVLRTQIPDVVLLDLSDWELVAPLARILKQAELSGVIVGISHRWTRSEQLDFEEVGILELLPAPFSPAQLEAKVYDALHREKPVQHQNLLAFLPSKAGGGSSTVALNTAAALVNHTSQGEPKKVLLIEADSRSGVFSILLNLKDSAGLPEALRSAAEMTGLEWSRSVVQVAGIHLLPAHPVRRGPLPTWADYYQLLRFASDRYDYIVVDLPEVINSATTELVRAARATFITCTPEVPSLAMASLRASELDAFEIPREKVKVLVNRYERGTLSMEEIERILARPVFATLPNEYREVKKSIMESRLVSTSSSFGKSCAALAQKIGGLGQAAPTASRFALLRKLSALTGVLP